MLEQLLLQRGITPTEFGRMLESDYLLARRWIKGKGFDKNVRNQARAAKLLGVPSNYFRSPDEAERRETMRRREFDKFCTTELGQSMSVEEYASLNSIQLFIDAYPTVAYYQIQLGLLRGNLPRAIADEATRMNDRADAELAKGRSEKLAGAVGKGLPPSVGAKGGTGERERSRGGSKRESGADEAKKPPRKGPLK